ncbi:hypothetical protein TIFTF001_005000 [Ficus carica]|uniref:Uncharacterized protein n=1 Tax=Ficus carica TaxID=3494 RepID=A0AA88A047_FICCA|nr:hypothetical protein TIFTF001_005000 [Ficus carica]
MKIFLLILLVQTLVVLLTLSHLDAAVEYGNQHRPKKTYIIHMDKSNKPAVFADHVNWYESSLKSVSESAKMLYTYNNVLHGFSTRITEDEAHLLKNQPGVLSVIPETREELHTTRTPDFFGLEKSYSLLPASDKVSDIVIGVLDTGVWPEIESYNDKGLGPVPRSWKGKCESGKNFNSSSCNRKLIGARFFSKGYEEESGKIDEKVESKSPIDDNGHGTHTSTTAAGSSVSKASFLGFASGKARGMAPTARVASYKVCWLGGCFGSDIIAAVDAAIEDGVHIISKSFGGSYPGRYHSDTTAIAAFAATARGILVSASGGNNGPSTTTVTNIAPWMTTVGAGTIDRDFPAYVKLGNGKTYKGVSLYKGKQLSDKVLVPIIHGGSASNDTDEGNFCVPGSLIPEKVNGKIVICIQGRTGKVQAGLVVKDAGGVGMVYTREHQSTGEELSAAPYLLPAAAVSLEKGTEIRTYVDSVPNPTATIIQGTTVLGVQPSPIVASFSSRGPNLRTRRILKPDIIAPGVNILAGWTGAVGPSGLARDKRRVSFNIISGTSMSCPHVSGIAALLKAAHPKWSPAAIRSALMTTAYSTYKNGKTIEDVVTASAATPFDFGAGHVDPVAALDPGLVYDTTVEDYKDFLCALHYTPEQIKTVTNTNFTCNASKVYNVEDLNYPSFAIPLLAEIDDFGAVTNVTRTVTYTRTLTNVGTPATYRASVSKVDVVKILVKPKSLSFKKAYEKKSYTVTFIANNMEWGSERFGRLEWSDGKHIVGSPIAFTWT